MPRIKNLHDAFLKAGKLEDSCTNFLCWLLGKLPLQVFSTICTHSQLSIEAVTDFVVKVQYRLRDSHSRPDAVIEFQDGKFIVVETKLFPNSFNLEQFTNHCKGGISEFGADNTWFLFLSGDHTAPSQLETLRVKSPGRIGFISWGSILELLQQSKSALPDKYEIILEEFFGFAHSNRLGRFKSMNTEELIKFIEVYPLVEPRKEAALEILGEFLQDLSRRIITECEEMVEDQEDVQETLPSLYRCFKIKGWHSDYSAYLFLNILLNKIGIVLSGYQGDSTRKEKLAFLERWNSHMKAKYKEDPKLESFTEIGKGEDEYAINGNYFKAVAGIAGKVFNPEKLSEFEDCFYWGYSYDFRISDKNSHLENIPKDFKRLLNCFLTGGLAEKSSKRLAKR